MPPNIPDQTELVLFVSCVTDKPVTRFSTTPAAKTIIGAMRLEGRLVYDEKIIVALTRAEATIFEREYARAINDGYLKKRTKAEWEAWRKEQKEVAKKAAEETAKAAAEEAARAADNGPNESAGGAVS